MTLRVARDDLVASSLKATRHFSVAGWCKNFDVTFQGEQGIGCVTRVGQDVARDDLVASSLKATRHFSVADWCKNFDVTFQGEQGIVQRYPM
ncbi:putative ubiquitin-protein ligase [Operophtera brumata]|uniref:Putative ubiquitin-protein ligase n=1 Tax=Operophtera brumata TaxID=104452 RepID=A0A0L7LKQ1_OPEBR|nr:putative ubiquitin-protein ligase [Operophtera brumata]